MKSLDILAFAASALLFGFTSCDKRPAAKFQPGDRVRVKATQAEGKVCLRTRFFRKDLYFVTLPESYYVFHTIGERREWARWRALTKTQLGFPLPEYRPRPWHEEGPFYDSDLELSR
jgi:hypothetical protein